MHVQIYVKEQAVSRKTEMDKLLQENVFEIVISWVWSRSEKNA